MLSLDERIRLLEGVLQDSTSTTPSTTTPQLLVRKDSTTSQVISSGGENTATSDIDQTMSARSDSISQGSDGFPIHHGSLPELTFSSGWLDNNFLAAKSFSIDRLNDQSHLNDSSDMSQAMIALDGALSEFGILSGVATNEGSAHHVSRDEGQKAIQGDSMANLRKLEIFSDRFSGIGLSERRILHISPRPRFHTVRW